MARNGTSLPRTATENRKESSALGPNDFITVRVHAKASEGVEKIAKALSKRAEDDLNVRGIRVDLGKAHIWDVAVDHLAKELGVEL